MNGTRPSGRAPWFAGLALAAATPPAWFPGAEWLVLVGLAAWFLVAVDDRRPTWHSYVLGCVHMAVFSWSVRHVLVFAWVMIVLLGGLYYALVRVAVRSLPRPVAAPGFAIAVAASCWLRANMPEIWYPHGQPCQALWQWPALLHSVVVGGEALANGLLAWLAASLGALWCSWRIGMPGWSAACRGVAIALGAGVAATVAGRLVAAGRGEPATGPITVAAIEPGFHLHQELSPLPMAQRGARFQQLFDERLLRPTRELLAAPQPPDVVLWPESSVFDEVATADIRAGTARVRALLGRFAGQRAQLLLGMNVVGDGKGKPTPAAVQVELPGARIVGHQEKRCLVPGGEFQPFLHWLPDDVAATLAGWFAAALGSLPDAAPGAELPPLTAAGVKFGALLCYDNAFPGPAAAQVAAGARWLCVLSNESWYEGGGELAQLMAMTVLRALETGTPIVRCTQDGWTGFVDAAGHLAAALPVQPAPQPVPRILRASFVLGPGQLPPLAWLRQGTGPAAALALLAMLLHGAWRWARLRAARTAPRAAFLPGRPGGEHGSGS